MNKLINISLAAIAGVVMFSSCDNIDENDRFIPVERPTVERVVLVQEFTGMTCVNCPTGASTIHDLQNKYPDSMVAVCMHPKGTPFNDALDDLDLTSDEATAYYNYFRPNGFPCAIVDGGALNYNISQWPKLVDTAISKKAPATIELTTDYDKATNEVTANYKVVFNETYGNEASVLVWIIENGIEGWQDSLDGLLFDYVHNHVLRASLNGTWGESIGKSFYPEDTFEGTAKLKLRDGWVAENCQIVAFVFQTGSKVVEQTTIADVVTSEN